MPFAGKFRAMMDFPFPGDTVGGFTVESVSVEDEWGHPEGYVYAVRMVLRGPASVIAAGPHCLGDRATHWSANCWILQCAIDDHGVESCDRCDDFPCERLVQWASQNESYAAALGRLRQMRDAGA